MNRLFLMLTGLFTLVCLAGTAVAQTNIAPLFEPPTEAEIDAVWADWNGRDVQAYNWQTVGTSTFNQFTVDVVSHGVAGNTHYGFVRYPADYDPAQSYGLLILNHGGIGRVSPGIMGGFGTDCLRDKFLVVPSFRGETLAADALGFGDLQSGGEVSEFDGDIDDVLALVNGTLANYAGADAADMSVFGGSRGGAVSYLQSIRDPRISKAVYFFGATDHMTYPALEQTVAQIMTKGQGAGPFYATVVNIAEQYEAGTLTLAQARQQLLMRSAIHFVGRLPAAIQIHHGAQDNVVPVAHSQLLNEALLANNLPIGAYAYYEYPDGTHGGNMPDSAERRNDFLCSTATTIPTAVSVAGTETTSGVSAVISAIVICALLLASKAIIQLSKQA